MDTVLAILVTVLASTLSSVHSQPTACDVIGSSARSHDVIDVCLSAIRAAARWRTFLPEGSLEELEVFLNITVSTPRLQFEFCCQDQVHPARPTVLRPLAQDHNPSALYLRSGAKIQAQLVPPPPRANQGVLYTLLSVDPDVPDLVPPIATQSRPILHWLHTNLHLTSAGILNLSSGHDLYPYNGPMPPDLEQHTYYFLLLEQAEGRIDLQDQRSFTGECPDNFKHKCLFDVAGLMSTYHLKLAGLTWITSHQDDWVRKIYGWSRLDQVCSGRPGYTDPCPESGANTLCCHSALLWMCSVFAFLVYKCSLKS